jgi:hypothetical protein
LFPEQPCDPAEPDAAIAVPGGATERLQQLMVRAESARQLPPPAARDGEGIERLGAVLKGDPRWSDCSNQSQVVVEMHAGAKRVREPWGG